MSKVSPHEEKMINLRQQMTNNQADLSSYLKDLGNWEEDIKKKEESLLSGKGVEKVSDLPPVRNTIHKKKLKKKKKEPKARDPAKPPKIRGFDFKAWDKFDVDKACAEIDNEDKDGNKHTSSSEYETDEEWEMERKKHLAGIQKEKGNEFLKKGDFELATEAYTKGIEFDPTNAILVANRAMALLKQQKFGAAELDCTTSISLDPLYVKAYLRRATARASLGKLTDAVSDFNRVLDLEPTNKQAKDEIERINKEITRSKNKPVETSLIDNDGLGSVKPIYKQPEERSKKPLFRVQIEEIGLQTTTRPGPSAEQSELTKKITAKEKEEFDKLFTKSTDSVTKPTTAEPNPTSDSSLVNGVSDVSLDTSKQQSFKLEETKKQTLPALSKPQPQHNSMPASTTTASSQREPQSETSSPQQPPSPNGVHSGDTLTFSIPQSSFQFAADFKQLKNNPESFFNYFKVIPPEQYPKLFGSSIDADILTTVLKALSLHPDQVSLYKVLQSLSTVKRFSMTAMFLSKKEKEATRNLFRLLKTSQDISEKDINSLRKAYDL